MIHWYEHLDLCDTPVADGHEIVAVVETLEGTVYLISRYGACGGPHQYGAKRYPDGAWFTSERENDVADAVARAAGTTRERADSFVAEECSGEDACAERLTLTGRGQ